MRRSLRVRIVHMRPISGGRWVVGEVTISALRSIPTDIPLSCGKKKISISKCVYFFSCDWDLDRIYFVDSADSANLPISLLFSLWWALDLPHFETSTSNLFLLCLHTNNSQVKRRNRRNFASSQKLVRSVGIWKRLWDNTSRNTEILLSTKPTAVMNIYRANCLADLNLR